jgi:hypothetical protein
MPVPSTFRAMHGEETQKDIYGQIDDGLRRAHNTYMKQGAKLTIGQRRDLKDLLTRISNDIHRKTFN